MPDVMKTVGRYEILRELGRGGMALVYLARQTDLDRFVALKELGAFHASDASFAQRFLRESRVAGSLSHPNIVTVHDYFEHEGTPYIAMEYVERGSLRPYVGQMTLAQIGGVLEGLLAGLTNAEQNGIVHRDLKPENLMVTSDGRVKIADFGIAKATTKMQTGAFLTATGTTVGTPTYMAPEQAMAQDIGPWTDLYSVGCMAFEMFTGKVPFHDSDAPMAILLRHVNEPIAPVKSIDPSIDQGISDWIEKMLVKDPTQRTQSAADAWDDFEEIIIGLLGPRWRRAARLVERHGEPRQPEPADAGAVPGHQRGRARPRTSSRASRGGRRAETGAAPARAGAVHAAAAGPAARPDGGVARAGGAARAARARSRRPSPPRPPRGAAPRRRPEAPPAPTPARPSASCRPTSRSPTRVRDVRRRPPRRRRPTRWCPPPADAAPPAVTPPPAERGRRAAAPEPAPEPEPGPRAGARARARERPRLRDVHRAAAAAAARRGPGTDALRGLTDPAARRPPPEPEPVAPEPEPPSPSPPPPPRRRPRPRPSRSRRRPPPPAPEPTTPTPSRSPPRPRRRPGSRRHGHARGAAPAARDARPRRSPSAARRSASRRSASPKERKPPKPPKAPKPPKRSRRPAREPGAPSKAFPIALGRRRGDRHRARLPDRRLRRR